MSTLLLFCFKMNTKMLKSEYLENIQCVYNFRVVFVSQKNVCYNSFEKLITLLF